MMSEGVVVDVFRNSEETWLSNSSQRFRDKAKPYNCTAGVVFARGKSYCCVEGIREHNPYTTPI